MINGSVWVPGDLIGRNGSDPATKAQSPSLIDWKQHDKLTDERRSATSIGHIQVRSRPAGVCVGWGEWDDFLVWQSYGRHVDKNIVPDPDPQPREVDPMPLVTFVSETGKKHTIEPTLDQRRLPQRQDPLTLRESMDKEAKKRNQIARRSPASTTKHAQPSWGGTHGRHD